MPNDTKPNAPYSWFRRDQAATPTPPVEVAAPRKPANPAEPNRASDVMGGMVGGARDAMRNRRQMLNDL